MTLMVYLHQPESSRTDLRRVDSQRLQALHAELRRHSASDEREDR